MEFSNTITVERSPHDVFEFLSDFGRTLRSGMATDVSVSAYLFAHETPR